MCLASGLDCLHNDLDYKKWSKNRNIKSSNIWAKQNHHLTSLNHHQVALLKHLSICVGLSFIRE
ncbi:hypothetical protein Hanom_Chr16g01438901 [Helianthus anomalus]